MAVTRWPERVGLPLAVRKGARAARTGLWSGRLLVIFLCAALLTCVSTLWGSRSTPDPDAGKAALLHVLQCWHQVTQAHGVPYWIDYGTLLGSVRDGHIIPWDIPQDIDVGFFDADLPRLEGMRKDFERCGCHLLLNQEWRNRIFFGLGFFSIKRSPARLFYGSRWTNQYLDVGHYIPSLPSRKIATEVGYVHDRVMCAGQPFDKCAPMDIDRILPPTPCTLEGVDTMCPKDSHYVLRVLFGPDYSTPKKNYKPQDAVRDEETRNPTAGAASLDSDFERAGTANVNGYWQRYLYNGRRLNHGEYSLK